MSLSSESFHFFRVFEILYVLKLQDGDFSDPESSCSNFNPAVIISPSVLLHWPIETDRK